MTSERNHDDSSSDNCSKTSTDTLRAVDLGLITCHTCGVLNPVRQHTITTDDPTFSTVKCYKCRSHLHRRKENGFNRTLALVIAATILYIPANLLPLTITESILGTSEDTIIDNVVYFWHENDYFVASVIFIASIFIPILKLLILCFLMLAVHIQSIGRWKLQIKHCALMYRVVEFIGRWSMIDVFVVTLLTSLIQIPSLAMITAGVGTTAFAAVVILTMFASLSFDPRTIWDSYYAKTK